MAPELIYGNNYNRGLVGKQQMQFYGPKRVWLKNKQVPGLAMTRSIGDLVAASVGVTSEPEIQIFKNMRPIDKAIIIASDGIFDRLTNEEITQIVMNDQFYARRNADGAATYLMRESATRWQQEQGMIDDITIIVAYLNIPEKNYDAAGSKQEIPKT